MKILSTDRPAPVTKPKTDPLVIALIVTITVIVIIGVFVYLRQRKAIASLKSQLPTA